VSFLGVAGVLLTLFFSPLSGRASAPGLSPSFMMDLALGMLSRASRHQLIAQPGVLLLIGSIALMQVMFADASRICLILK